MAYNPPSVSNEKTINTGRTYAVESYQGPEPGLRIQVYTGNGDDGIGVAYWWAEPLELTFKPNALVEVSGEKVSSLAEILSIDGIGTPIEGDGETLLASQEYVVIPDLFDSEGMNLPDKVFAVSTGAPSPAQTFRVTKFAEPADQVFAVKVFAEPPDQIFDVLSVTRYEVATAEPPFVVKVFAEPADQIFEVISGPPAPDEIFTVTRGPDPNVDQIFEVLTVELFNVRVSYATPDQSFFVTVGPDPAPTPDQIFGVSVGGPDAPPVPAPDEIFSVTTGPAVPARTFGVQVVDQSFAVTTGLAPFVVTVGPDTPDQIFDVTAGATPPDQILSVVVGPELPNQTFEATVVETFAVDTYDAPASYNVTNNASLAYQFTGSGLAAESNPDISHTVGQLVTLSINADGHPFFICDTQTTGGCTLTPAWADQLDNNGTDSFQVRVRFNAPGTYWYNCSIHAAMSGRIVIPSQILTYQVTNSGTIDYVFSGAATGAGATITAAVGERLDFQVSTPGHPFWVKDTQTTGPGNASEPWADYLRGNGADTSTVSVVFNTPGTYYYNCQFHSGMRGAIVIS
ncbi:MAG: cupredoxin domain-containing protein [Pelagibacteraceae bacterium]